MSLRTRILSGSISIPNSSITPNCRRSTNGTFTSSPSDVVPLESLRGNGPESDSPIRGAQPGGRRPWDQRELLPSGLSGQRSPTQCGLGCDADRSGQRLLPMAGKTVAGLPEGRSQAVVPALRGDPRSRPNDG